MTETKSVDGALAAIDELRIDSKIGKSKHFEASDRKMFWHRALGIPVIVANLFVGIVLVNLQNTASANGYAQHTTAAVQSAAGSLVSDGNLFLLSIMLAFGAASLSGIQTFFNFHKAAEGHRAIGNRYVHVSRQCKALQQRHRDIPFSPEGLWDEYDKLYSEYTQINSEGESFPTSASDLKRAKGAAEISPYKNPHAKAI